MSLVSAPRILAITACPTGIAHTYMAAENLQVAAHKLGIDLRVETHGSVGIEGAFTPEEIRDADAVIIAADTVIDRQRFAGKRLLSAPVDAAIKNPADLLERAQQAPVYGVQAGARDAARDGAAEPAADADVHAREGVGRQLYTALMNGVSHMVPFVVTGGLLIAVALSVGGQPGPEGIAVPEDSFWNVIIQVGALAFGLMVPVLSAYISAGIAGRPGLAPGFITGMIAVTGSLYGSEAGAGFLGGIITGFLSGYVALALKKLPVGKYLAAIMPIIVIPILTTLIVGLLFVYVLGGPISALFDALTGWLASLDGASVVILGAVIGAMIAFDMGGPFNKTAFLFGGGLIASGNAAPMGMAAAAIAVPPLAVGVATLLRRAWFTRAERDSGVAALLMGFFGITEGAIPLAAARPLQVIPANVAGGAVAGALAGVFHVEDNVMHGGPIVAVLGAVENTVGFFAALLAGIAVTAGLILVLVGLSRRGGTQPAAEDDAVVEPAPAASPSAAHAELIDAPLVLLGARAPRGSREDVIRALVDNAADQGRIADAESVVASALAREELATTAVGNAVAIPHARTAGVSAPTLSFARLAEGVDWSSPDGEPVRMVFLIAVPEDSGKQHLRVLSTLARAIMREEFRASLLGASSEQEALDIIREVTPQARGAALGA